MASTKTIELENGTTVQVSTTSYPISTHKFRNIVEEKGLMFSEMSARLGYGQTVISNGLCRGYFSNALITGLENVFHIPYEDYEYKPPVKEPEPVAPNPDDAVHEAEKAEENERPAPGMSESAMYGLVYSAVYDAMDKLLQRRLQDFRNAMYTSILCAMRKNREERQGQTK